MKFWDSSAWVPLLVTGADHQIERFGFAMDSFIVPNPRSK